MTKKKSPIINIKNKNLVIIPIIVFILASIGFLVNSKYRKTNFSNPSLIETPSSLNSTLPTPVFENKKTNPPSQTPKNIKKISYFVPTGWITDALDTFQISYDPSKLHKCYNGEHGIVLCSAYNTYFSIDILPYDGGSRHLFIYNNGLGTPKKSELFSDYYEKEYNMDGKSCLILNGISVSQFPVIWGVCAIDSSRALLFYSYDRDEDSYLSILKTFNLLK
ncbi:MAG TPA: hypothetical protein VI795_00940 [Patescibacteria group bacterium]|nr:hypothetical protein [Patescibacteria group bacterium]